MTHTITLSLSDAEVEDLRAWQARPDHTGLRPGLAALLRAELPGYVPKVGDLIDIRPMPGTSCGMRSVMSGERVVAVTERHVFTEYDWSADAYRLADYQFRPHNADDADDWLYHRR